MTLFPNLNLQVIKFLSLVFRFAQWLTTGPAHHLGTPAVNVRLAKPNEIDAVVDVVIAAMPEDPAWIYRFPYRREYPDDHRRFNRLLFEALINPTYDDWEVVVVEYPKDDISEAIIVAFAVFNISYINFRKNGASYQPQNPSAYVDNHGGCERRDANWKHVTAFREVLDRAQKKYFDPMYRADQVHLQILGTHPDYRRRGFGTALCKWGMKKAQRDNVTLTSMASPMGFKLYASLKFRDRGVEIVQLPKEKEKLTVHAVDFVPGDGVRLDLYYGSYEKNSNVARPHEISA